MYIIHHSLTIPTIMSVAVLADMPCLKESNKFPMPHQENANKQPRLQT